MKQLSALNIACLRTEESFGYQKQVVAETANLPNEEPSGAQTAAVTASHCSTRANSIRKSTGGSSRPRKQASKW